MHIVLVDEHYLLTDALKNIFLQMPEISHVETYIGGREFLAVQRIKTPDILILDLMMNAPTGLELLDICRATFSKEMKVIVLSTVTDVHTIKHAIRRGANSFLSKSTPLEELIESMTQVSAGKQYIGRSVRDNLISSVFTDEQVVLHLSPREKEVLQKVCSGRTIKEIAYDLKLSAHTVQYYHSSVMEKLKVKRTTDLIVYAMQHGLFIPESNK